MHWQWAKTTTKFKFTWITVTGVGYNVRHPDKLLHSGRLLHTSVSPPHTVNMITVFQKSQQLSSLPNTVGIKS